MTPRSATPMAAAMHWVARIFAAVMMMCLPGLGGQWLDGWLGTRFMVFVGFAFGLVGGMTYLIAATREDEAQRKAARMEQVDQGTSNDK